MLTTDDLRRLRLAAQGLVPTLGLGPAAVVDRAVALQGQDLPAVLQAIALRAGTDVAEVRAAFDRGELVRSWPMRGTLFATTPRRLAGLLSLTAERTERSMARRREQLGIDDAVVARSAEVAAKAVADGPVTRAGMLARWEDAGIATAGGRGYHLIVLHAVRSLWHWGPFEEGEQCLVASPAVAPGQPEQLLTEVVDGYVRARGPVTLEDIVWWTKLTKGQVRRAVSLCDGLAEVAVARSDATHLVHREQYDVLGDLPTLAGHVCLLPGFDEYYLGYGDRDLVASAAMQQAVVPGNNGVFRPLIVVDGRVVGTWRLGREGGEVRDLVESLNAAQQQAVDHALAAVDRG